MLKFNRVVSYRFNLQQTKIFLTLSPSLHSISSPKNDNSTFGNFVRRLRDEQQKNNFWHSIKIRSLGRWWKEHSVFSRAAHCCWFLSANWTHLFAPGRIENQKSSNAFYYSFFGIIFVVVMWDESWKWVVESKRVEWGKLFKSIMILIKFLSKNVAVEIFINFPSITFFMKVFFRKISMKRRRGNRDAVRGWEKSSEMVFDFD